MAKVSRLVALAAVVALGAACTVHQDAAQTLAGPSGLATTATVTATPDHITQDGASQSAIQILVIGPDGRGKGGVSVRVDMTVGGVVQDYGTLSARTLVTGSDGKATTVYTAPAAPAANANSGSTYVGIRAIPIGTDAAAFNAALAYVNLVPPGVILPPGGTPTPAFTFSPTPVNANVAATFDASGSCAAAAPCSGTSGITSFAWTFGDGSSGSGQTTSHTFTAVGAFSVTLTVTNDRGISASVTQSVTVTTSAGPTADFVFSPTAPVVNQNVLFNADPSKSAPGHNITQYNWNFGDGTSATGVNATHKFASAGTYSVALSVLDDTNQRAVTTKSVTIGTGNPVPLFTVSPASPTHAVAATFDASGTTFFGGATGQTYTWAWGDGTANTSGAASSVQHTFTLAGTYTVTLTVTDNTSPTGRVGVTSQSVTVQ